ncbi:MAG: hypothetical protein RI897_3589 [Verrucomicrobiota bacterium]
MGVFLCGLGVEAFFQGGEGFGEVVVLGGVIDCLPEVRGQGLLEEGGVGFQEGGGLGVIGLEQVAQFRGDFGEFLRVDGLGGSCGCGGCGWCGGGGLGQGGLEVLGELVERRKEFFAGVAFFRSGSLLAEDIFEVGGERLDFRGAEIAGDTFD